MRLLLTGRNVEITPALRQLVTRKLSRLDRMLNDSALSAQVVLTREKYRHLAEVTVHARGDHMLHGIGDSTQWQASLKGAVEKIAQQAQRLTGKWKTRKRRASSARTLPASVAGPAESAPPGARRQAAPAADRIVRTRYDAVKPMTLEDAALQIQANQAGVVVFRNATTDAVSILYRRSDGRLGLIEPEI